MADLPVYLNPEVGYALHWLTHPELGPATSTEIVERLLARGHVNSRAEAQAVLRQARSNVTAQARLIRASTDSSLRQACDYKCPPDTPIALRIVVNAVDERGNVYEQRSVVVQGYASENLGDVLQRARNLFNRRFRRGNSRYSHALRIDHDLTPADVAQVLLNYTEGQP